MSTIDRYVALLEAARKVRTVGFPDSDPDIPESGSFREGRENLLRFQALISEDDAVSEVAVRSFRRGVRVGALREAALLLEVESASWVDPGGSPVLGAFYTAAKSVTAQMAKRIRSWASEVESGERE